MQDTSAIDKIKQRIRELQDEIVAHQKALELLLPYHQELFIKKSPEERINDLVVIDFAKKIIKASAAEEVEKIIKQKNRFLHINEIAQFLNDANGYNDLELAKKKTRSALDFLKKEDKIVRYAINGRNEFSFYGFKEWLSAKDEIIEGHRFSQTYINHLV